MADSPPSYEAEQHPSPHFTTKRGYVAVPVESAEPSGSTSILHHTIEDTSDSLGLIANDGVYCGFNEGVRDNSALYKLISSHALTSAPQFYIRIKCYLFANSMTEHFSFTIPLPKFQSAQNDIFGKADDCPSLREKRVFTGFDTEFLSIYSKHDEQLEWPDQYSQKHQACIQDPIGNFAKVAPSSSLQHWNARRRRANIPPWVSLAEGGYNRQASSSLDKGHARRLLRSFLTPDPSNANALWSRWLVVPHCAYGWDLEFIEVEINKMIPRGWFNSFSVNRVTVEIVNPAPLMRVRYFSSQITAKIYQSPLIALADLSLMIIFISILSIVLVGTTLWFLIIDMSRLSSLPFRTFAIFCLLSILAFGLRAVLANYESVNDTVGVAWALQKWIKTDISPLFSKEEAIKEIQKAGLGNQQVCEDRMQKREDGWYLLLGMTESNWLEKYGQDVKAAIQNNQRGNLNHLFDH